MRSNNINYLAVGSFVIAAVTGLIVVVALLAGRTGPTDSYYAIYQNITGVKFGTQVLYEGYPIGQVVKVTPQPKNGHMQFRIDFDVQKGWQIPEDSQVQIGAASLLAAVSLNITAGKSLAALKTGGQLASKESANLFDVLANVATDISTMTEENVKPLLSQLTRGGTILNDLLQKDGQVIVSHLRVLIDDLASRAPKIVDQVGTFAGDLQRLGVNLNRSADEMNKILNPETRNKVLGVVDNLDRAAAQIDNLMTEANVLVGSANDMVDHNRGNVDQITDDLRHTAESLARHIDSINHHLDGASRNMYEFSRQIRQNPGLLLGGTPPTDNAQPE